MIKKFTSKKLSKLFYLAIALDALVALSFLWATRNVTSLGSEAVQSALQGNGLILRFIQIALVFSLATSITVLIEMFRTKNSSSPLVVLILLMILTSGFALTVNQLTDLLSVLDKGVLADAWLDVGTFFYHLLLPAILGSLVHKLITYIYYQTSKST